MLLIRRLLLILALVFGQWIAVAHASEHHALAQKHACEQCLQAQALDGGIAATAPTLEFDAARDGVAGVAAAAPAIAVRPRYRSRAPPQTSLS